MAVCLRPACVSLCFFPAGVCHAYLQSPAVEAEARGARRGPPGVERPRRCPRDLGNRAVGGAGDVTAAAPRGGRRAWRERAGPAGLGAVCVPPRIGRPRPCPARGLQGDLFPAPRSSAPRDSCKMNGAGGRWSRMQTGRRFREGPGRAAFPGESPSGRLCSPEEASLSGTGRPPPESRLPAGARRPWVAREGGSCSGGMLQLSTWLRFS